MGIDPRFVSAASAIPPSSMLWLSSDEMATWKVAYDPELFTAWFIEPWNGGIVAFAKSADEKTTATVFCTDDGIPKLFITSEVYWWKEGDFVDPRPYLDKLSVFGIDVPISDVNISYRPGKYDLRINLRNFETSKLPSGDSIGIEAWVGRAYSVMFNFQMRRYGAEENMRAALRNCIR